MKRREEKGGEVGRRGVFIDASGDGDRPSDDGGTQEKRPQGILPNGQRAVGAKRNIIKGKSL